MALAGDPERPAGAAPASRRGRLLWKYVAVFAGLVSAALLASGLLELYFSYLETQTALVALQREKAQAAAARIEAFVREIERQMGWITQPSLASGAAALEQRRVDAYRLQRQVRAITDLAYLDSGGREQLRVSRLAMEVVGSQADFSADPRFTEARAGRTWFGPVYFRKESEPYMSIAMPLSGGAGVTVAEVNLKFIWDVVSEIRIGKAGRAYVVDATGTLVGHPDISLVLRKTSLARLPHVQGALVGPGREPSAFAATVSRDLDGHQVLTAHAPIAPLRWTVFAEQPLAEALEPLDASIKRTLLLLGLGVALSAAAGLLLARRMVRPIRTLGEGAARIGAGELGHRITVKTGDELEALAEQFNRMTAQLQESYATLERRVQERTRELSEALAQQTATAEILRVISSSPTDFQPVMAVIAENAARVCAAYDAGVFLRDGETIRVAAHRGPIPFPSESTLPLSRGLVSGRAILDARPVQVEDLASAEEFAEGRHLAREFGYRTTVAVPLIREGQAIGAIVIRRREVRPFADTQVALLKTFAAQAVIAVENVRLFQELQARTAELTRSVEELQALGDVGRAVSSSLDLETVLATIVSRASQLSGAEGGMVYEYDEAADAFVLRATQNMDAELVQVLQVTPIRRGEGAVGRMAETRQPVQIQDTLAETYRSPVRDLLARTGYRAILAVPLLREGKIIGGLLVNRKAPGAFDPRVVELLQTFATQSALALQNARLFQEIEEKSRQLEVANRHKSEFLANMSHELRTPLNAIIGFSEVLVERMFGEINAKQEEYLRDIYESGRHLLSLINDILDLSKVEAGRMELERSTFDLPQAIQNALMLVRGRAEAHGIRLGVALDPGLGDFVGDERKVKQILVNLLSNAVKFTPEGGRVEVQAVLADAAVEIAVSDTGVGIAPEDQEAIFEAFRQVGGDAARKREGTGLGLSLTRRFVELHGGSIWVKSDPGRGSTFTFTLPVRPWPTS